MLDIVILPSVQSVQKISFWAAMAIEHLVSMQALALSLRYMINKRYVYDANELRPEAIKMTIQSLLSYTI